MKRKLALIILTLIAVSVVLVACNQAEATEVESRWSNETHVFHVSLADYAGTNSNSVFKSYDANGVAADNGEYRKDRVITGEPIYSKDEITPNAVSGTYTLTIKVTAGADTCEVEGRQVLYVQYLLMSTVQGETVNLTEWEDLNNAKALSEEIPADLDQDVADSVILKSETVTTAKFKYESQQPISSSTTVNGFYLGKDNQELTKYSVSTVYDFADSKKSTATVTFNNEIDNVVNRVHTYKLARNSASTLIDANQMLLYVRSLGKTASSLQDSKTINVFNPLTGSTQTASFGFIYEDKVILSNQEETLGTKLNCVSVTVGGLAFMVQDNVPGTVKKDQTPSGIATLPRYSTVRFRVGYLTYEIDYSNETNHSYWNPIWEALKPAPAEEEETTPQE